jgi:hypothetical protein
VTEIEGQLQAGQRGLGQPVARDNVIGIGGNLLERHDAAIPGNRAADMIDYLLGWYRQLDRR